MSLLTSAPTLAEPAPDFAWSVRAGGVKADKTRGLCTDAGGNIYLTGEFSGSADFGAFTVESKGGMDFFVAKYSPAGQCLWVRTGGGAKTDRGYGVAVDARGNVFTTGHCESADAAFDGTPLLGHRGDYDLFVAKHDAKGKLLWLKSGGGAGYDFGHSLSVDQAGNCYVTGSFIGDCEFAGRSVKNSRGGHALLAKLTPDGGLAWLNVPQGNGSSTGQHLAVDAGGNCVVSGGVAGVESFGTLTLTNKGGRDVFAVKYDATGKVLWAFKGDGSTNAGFASVALDGKGGVALCGMFQGALKLGGRTIESRGAHDIVVAKLSPDGKLRWFHTGGSPRTDYALCIAADAADNCYVTGELSDGMELLGRAYKAAGRDLYVAKFDDAGALRWLRPGGGEKNDLSYCVALDRRGNIFLSGAFAATTAYGKTPPLTSKGANDIMLIKLGQ